MLFDLWIEEENLRMLSSAQPSSLGTSLSSSVWFSAPPCRHVGRTWPPSSTSQLGGRAFPNLKASEQSVLTLTLGHDLSHRVTHTVGTDPHPSPAPPHPRALPYPHSHIPLTSLPTLLRQFPSHTTQTSLQVIPLPTQAEPGHVTKQFCPARQIFHSAQIDN